MWPLEHYIVEVHSITPVTDSWTEKFEDALVAVDITDNVYGTITRRTRVFSEPEWAEIKNRGWYYG
jgi:NADPH-dependent 2,4-dienoyl-CoA reductase/sulfur reductase-like enzyme